jgi:hypothetical protein
LFFRAPWPVSVLNLPCVGISEAVMGSVSHWEKLLHVSLWHLANSASIHCLTIQTLILDFCTSLCCPVYSKYTISKLIVDSTIAMHASETSLMVCSFLALVSFPMSPVT